MGWGIFMNMKYSLYKIKEGKKDQWADWCKELNTTYRSEALKTLEEENILFESFFIFQIGSEFYTIGCGAEKEGGGKKVDKENELNKRHFANKRECLEFVSKGESDYFIYNH